MTQAEQNQQKETEEKKKENKSSEETVTIKVEIKNPGFDPATRM